MGKPPRHRNSPNAITAAATTNNHGSASPSNFSPPSYLSSNNSTGAPSSVMCVPAPLTRELSDLSGSYMNGNTAPRGISNNRSFGNSVCSSTAQDEPVQGFWRQAYLLSTPCPKEPAPPPPVAAVQSQSQSSSALIVVERNGVIELVKKSDSNTSGGEEGQEQQHQPLHQASLGALMGTIDHNTNTNTKKNAEISHEDLLFLSHTSPSFHADEDESQRIPILILLLDPGRKQYELMQLWVDPQSDLVRDVLHALQRKLSDKWRQDYDGLFQLRGDKFCQLVHILSIAKYDVRPRELWVAKPWSMAAKSAIDISRDCISQLRAGGVLDVYPNASSGKSRIKNFLRKTSKEGRESPVFVSDIPLTLSEEAVKRMYIPDGTLKHHHACQFLSFRVPAIPSRVVGGHQHRTNNSSSSQYSNRSFLGSLLGAPNQSFDDVSSQLSDPSDAMLRPLNADNKLNSTSSFSTASPSPSPSRRQRHGHGGYSPSFRPYHNSNRHPSPVNLNSRWKPSGPLEVVGEVFVTSTHGQSEANNHDTSDQEQPETNISEILADLETTWKEPDLETTWKERDLPSNVEPPLTDDITEYSKKGRCSIWKLLLPLNCFRRLGTGEEGYQSSWGGDASRSSGAKSKRSRSSGGSGNNSGNNNDNDIDGRCETPTSKGTDMGEEQSLNWNPKWKASAEESSVISDSAPLLSSLLDTSSTAGRPNHAKLQKEQAISHSQQQQTALVSPKPFARYTG